MISKIIKNALEVRKTEKGYMPLRFSKNQLLEYENRSEAMQIRVYCPAGIVLHFRTQDKEISFDYYTEAFIRDWFCFDIYEDGILVEKIFDDKNSEGTRTITYSVKSPKSNPEIKIYLPQTNVIYLSNLIGNVSEVSEKGKFNYLALGDSITQGMDSKSPSFAYPVLIQDFFGFNLLNQAVGGGVFDHDLLDYDLPFKPDFITVAYGTNDSGSNKSLDEIDCNIRLYFEKLRDIYRETPIVAITPIFRAGDIDGRLEKLNKVRATIEKTSKKHSIYTINGEKIFPHISDFFGDLRVHPTSEGFLYMANNIIKNILSYQELSFKPKSGLGYHNKP